MNTYLEFPNESEARAYRHDKGTGGWIFVAETTGAATIFPPEFPPMRIFHHPLAKGQSGRLIGSQ